jgi:hypothetical protein
VLHLSARVVGLALSCTCMAAATAHAQTREPDPIVVDAGPAALDPRAAAVLDAGAPVVDGLPARPVEVEDGGASPAIDDVAPVPAPDPGARPDVGAPRTDETAARVDPAGYVEPREGPAMAAPPPAELVEPHLGFGGVPALAYDADNGFGFGVLGTLYWLDGTKPYRYALTLQLVLTTKLLTDDYVSLDAVDFLDLPLRLGVKAGYLQTASQNYCGLGAGVTCDPGVARRAASKISAQAEREQFERRYYQVRFAAPNATLQARWALLPGPNKLEVFGGWRAYWYIPGTPFDEDGDGAPDTFPYPGSLYAQRFPQGEGGLASVLQAGVMLDGRDNEPAPTRGYWLEGSLRAATPVWGAAWTWAGANVTARGYVPLDSARELVLATRLVLDVVVGDIPVMEMARVGGSSDYYAFGGSEMGRGVRVQRYMGKVKALDQTELRWTPLHWDMFEQRFDFGVGAFVDAGLIGDDVLDLGPDSGRILFGTGALARLVWNENFVLRLDVATSPEEGWGVSPYILVNNLF